VYSQGIYVLAFLSAFLLPAVWWCDGPPDPLYAVCAFLAFNPLPSRHGGALEAERGAKIKKQHIRERDGRCGNCN